MSEWLDLDVFCDNCSKRLSGRWGKPRGGFILEGAYPMEFRHTDGTTECVIHRKPKPYSIWLANRAMKNIEDVIEREKGES